MDMRVEAEVAIKGPKEEVWGVVTDLDNAPQIFRGIEKVEVLKRPSEGLVGLKWRETRMSFGRASTEELWITECAENDFYKACAESNGFAYTSTIRVGEDPEGTSLAVCFEGRPRSLLAKLLSVPAALFYREPAKRVLVDMLYCVKEAVERRRRGLPRAKEAVRRVSEGREAGSFAADPLKKREMGDW